MEKIQQEFEAWAIKHHFSVTKKPDGASYAHDSTMCAFEGWKASRSELCVELPQSDDDSQDAYVRRLEFFLDEAGVSYK